MIYSGKKLPEGFTYMLNKKDLRDIEDIVNYPIESVYLEGTSYGETKMARYSYDKTECTYYSVVYIKFIKEETNLIIHLKLEGIRKSHFADKESFFSQKEKVKTETIETIRKGIYRY